MRRSFPAALRGLAAIVTAAAVSTPVRAAGPGPGAVARSIDRGVKALALAQKPSGGFDLCVDVDAPSCEAQSTIFVPALVVASLESLRDPEARRVAARARRFLDGQREAGGWWRFWSTDDRRHEEVPPDVDDTACAAGLSSAKDTDDSWQAMARVRESGGPFATWSDSRAMIAMHRGYINHLLTQGYGRRTRSGNDVDCAVNANILWMAARQKRDGGALCEYLDRMVARERLTRCSIYYASPVYAEYFFARAYAAGAQCLATSRLALQRAVLAERRNGGWTDELETAAALAALQWLEYRGAEIDQAAAALVSAQRPDGLWPPHALIRPTHGASAVTTAIAVQALAGYRTSTAR